MPVITNDELQNRLAALQKGLAALNLDGALLVHNVDLLYFAGTAQNAHLYVPVQGSPVLFVKQNLDRARAESPLTSVQPMPSLKELPLTLREYGFPASAKLGMELDVLPASRFLHYQKLFHPAEITDVSQLIRNIRSIKSPFEIELMRAAAKLTDEVFASIPSLFQPGISEIKLAGLIEARFRQAGHSGLIRMRGLNAELFYGHLLSGPNMAIPSSVDSPTGGAGTGPHFPQGASLKPIEPDQPFQVDFVGSFFGYLIDQTRLFVPGKLDAHLKKAFETALTIQSTLADLARPGFPSGQLYIEAQRIAQEASLADHFMGDGRSCGFVGHGVGMELNEPPVLAPSSKTPLAEGMTIALEPKFIFNGLGGAGIENTFVVTENGLKRLGTLPDDIVYL